MKTIDWWTKVDGNWNSLRNAITQYHPLSNSYNCHGPITAPRVELACEIVREQIRRENDSDPLIRAEVAKSERDIIGLMSIFNQTWFGAPESRSVFGTPGFPTLCDLCSDPPDDIELDDDEDNDD